VLVGGRCTGVTGERGTKGDGGSNLLMVVVVFGWPANGFSSLVIAGD
jgi:hypothetical protein